MLKTYIMSYILTGSVVQSGAQVGQVGEAGKVAPSAQVRRN